MTDIVVNGEDRATPSGATLADVVGSLTGRGDGCAAAVNGDVVPRSDWATRILRTGDRVEVLTAVQGG